MNSNYTEKETIFSNHSKSEPEHFNRIMDNTIIINRIKREPLEKEAEELAQTSSYRKEVSQFDSTKEKSLHHSITKGFVHSKYINNDNDLSESYKNKVLPMNSYKKFVHSYTSKEKPVNYPTTKECVHLQHITKEGEHSDTNKN